MDQQAKDRIEGWLRDIEAKLCEAQSNLSCVMGALEDGGMAYRRAIWVGRHIEETREDYRGLATLTTRELERAVAGFESPGHAKLIAGAGI